MCGRCCDKYYVDAVNSGAAGPVIVTDADDGWQAGDARLA